MNVCSYHLQEAGATPVQELSYALATAIAVLDRVRQSGEVDEADFAEVVGRISFFVNAGMRFVTELAKMRAFVELGPFGARAAIGLEFEERGLPPFGFSPRFHLLAAQFAQAPPAEGVTVDIQNVRPGHVTRPRPSPWAARHGEN